MEPTDTNAIWTLPSKADVGWIAVAVPPTERVNLFAKGDGFDLYVDAARYLSAGLRLCSGSLALKALFVYSISVCVCMCAHAHTQAE